MNLGAIIIAGSMARPLAPVFLAVICLASSFSVRLLFQLCGLSERWAVSLSLLLAAVLFLLVWFLRSSEWLFFAVWVSVIGGALCILVLIVRAIQWALKRRSHNAR